MALSLAMHGVAQRIGYSSFEYTTTAGSPTDLKEALGDNKTPGDGYVYIGGSVEVVDTQNQPKFSGADVDVPSPLTPFSGSYRRQVAIIQKSNATDGVIQQQVYFHGNSPLYFPTIPGLHTNLRAISVWPASEPANVRIAICGETSDQLVPRAYTAEPTNPYPTATSPNSPVYSGYIAVFDGYMQLLWSHHLYGRSQYQHCAVTDISIRVVDGADVITYCGISSHGIDTTNPSENHTLLPQNYFTFTGAAQGDTDNGAGQWDGFVGRVVNPTSTVGGQTVVFHSVVGGRGQDGLFGLSEITDDRFVVVGSTSDTTGSGSSGLDFPFWTIDPSSQPTTGSYCLATVLGFDLAAVASQRLEASEALGHAGEDLASVARDVVVQRESLPVSTPQVDAVHVVGSTNDPAFFGAIHEAPVMTNAPQPTLNGGVGGTDFDGFLLSGANLANLTYHYFHAGTFHGDWGFDALHGVACWNEHKDHVSVFGVTEHQIPNDEPPATLDLDTCTYFLDSPNGPPPLYMVSDLIRLRRNIEVASLDQFPTGMGAKNVIDDASVTVTWDDHGTGSPAGGGVSVDQRGRVTGVGKTNYASNYPTYPGIPAARTGLGADDGIRTFLDMVPGDRVADIGVGRTDGTGWPGTTSMPMSGYDGGTTPVCALTPYGDRIGGTTPALLRMNIDVEGIVQAGNVISILVDRPPTTGTYGLSALQVDYPGVPSPYVLPGGQEIYTTNNPIWYPLIPQAGVWTPGSSLRFNMGTLPGSGWAFTVQMLFQVSQAIPAGQAGSCSGTTIQAASPALWVAY